MTRFNMADEDISPSHDSNTQKPMLHWVYSLMIMLLGWFGLPILLMSVHPERRRMGRIYGVFWALLFLIVGLTARVKQNIEIATFWLLIPLFFVGVVIWSSRRESWLQKPPISTQR